MRTPNQVAVRARAVPGWIRALLLTSSLGLASVWCLTYTGPYRVLAELQLDAFGSYEVVLTGALVVLVTLLPAAVIIQVLATFYQRVEAPDVRLQRAAHMAAEERTLVAHLGYVIAGAFFVGFVGTALYFLHDGLLAGPLTSLAVASLEAGKTPESRYVTLEGTLRFEDARTFETETQSTTIQKVFIPLVSASSRSRAPTVYLETYSTWLEMYRDELARGPFRGVLSEDGLPGPLRTELARSKLLPNGSVWVLDYRASPEESLTMAGVFGFCAGVVAVLASAVAWIRSRRGGPARMGA